MLLLNTIQGDRQMSPFQYNLEGAEYSASTNSMFTSYYYLFLDIYKWQDTQEGFS